MALEKGVSVTCGFGVLSSSLPFCMRSGNLDFGEGVERCARHIFMNQTKDDFFSWTGTLCPYKWLEMSITMICYWLVHAREVLFLRYSDIDFLFANFSDETKHIKKQSVNVKTTFLYNIICPGKASVCATTGHRTTQTIFFPFGLV